MVIQGTSSGDMKRYADKPECPGQVHRTIYWNVFGENADVSKVIGEGFVYRSRQFRWNSFFNKNSDAYHDELREISAVGKKCVQAIIEDWKEKSECGKTYSVEESVQFLPALPLLTQKINGLDFG